MSVHPDGVPVCSGPEWCSCWLLHPNVPSVCRSEMAHGLSAAPHPIHRGSGLGLSHILCVPLRLCLALADPGSAPFCNSTPTILPSGRGRRRAENRPRAPESEPGSPASRSLFGVSCSPSGASGQPRPPKRPMRQIFVDHLRPASWTHGGTGRARSPFSAARAGSKEHHNKTIPERGCYGVGDGV